MRVLVSKQNISLIPTLQTRMKILSDGKWRREAFRGVVDAGRKTKTQVQRSVHRQMATKNYGFVVANTRGTPKQAELAYEIYALKGGQRIELYKGLKALAAGGMAAARMNLGRQSGEGGLVRSGVWNSPRTFKRSFSQNGGFFALLPASAGKGRSTAPKALWTFGKKGNQPRGAGGRFAASSTTYGPIRRLYGPSLMKELIKDQSLATFQTVGPKLLEEKVMKRMEKLIKI